MKEILLELFGKFAEPLQKLLMDNGLVVTTVSCPKDTTSPTSFDKWCNDNNLIVDRFNSAELINHSLDGCKSLNMLCTECFGYYKCIHYYHNSEPSLDNLWDIKGTAKEYVERYNSFDESLIDNSHLHIMDDRAISCPVQRKGFDSLDDDI